MRQINNWDEIQEAEGYEKPVPGGYIAIITEVTDHEDKEYLCIEWDFAEGDYKGHNAQTFERIKFWPTRLFRSYKESALGYFKAFKTSVELSNKGYVFDTSNPHSLIGKAVGVVLGEEEYIKANGNEGKRLYVAQTRSVEAIRKGDFTIPDLKKRNPSSSSAGNGASSSGSQFNDINDYDEELPF